jgi:DNA-binding response OmpR family regulator
MTVLLVEDDFNLASAIIDYFELEGLECDYADNGLSALNLIAENAYKVLVLDINLPRKNGLEVCKTMRANGSNVPVIMLTAKGLLEDKLVGFDSGADDYLVKPFAMEELIARVNVLSNRQSGQALKLMVRDVEVNLSTHQVLKSGVEIKLSPLSFKILVCLIKASPNTVSKQELLSSIWQDTPPNASGLKVHIHSLRKELKESSGLSLIKTVPSIGYMIEKENED